MIKDSVFAAIEVANQQRAARRRFIKLAAGSTAVAGSLALLSACGGSDDPSPTPTPTPTPTASGTGVASDIAILQLALNLEYLEAQFYSIAVLGRALPESSLTGSVGTRGNVTGGRQVNFAGEPIIGQFAREIANDEIAHVNALRSVISAADPALVINQPAINIDGSATGAFAKAAQAAGIANADGTFDPYASVDNFLLAAFLFEDVGVSAYKGASPLITSAVYLEAAAGILAAEAYHAGLIRNEIYLRGNDARLKANKLADARDTLDGPGVRDGRLATVDATGAVTGPNLTPADSNGLAYSRSTGQVHNVVYLRTDAGIGGGFFPAGTNNSLESLRTSATPTATPSPTPTAT
ncbi:ferritin-like domain-containing protein [Sphingomonas sp.]|jgi:hypothetical protein|uniref:ferritin-like domain-containing protein n=1 Tax=Sphingomonas sp. TaxID=28214 RepID=UPI0035C8140E